MGSKKIDKIVDTFIEGAGKVSTGLLGMVNKIGGQIYALLFIHDEPLSLDDIAEKLNVSKSNVSINIRILEENQLAKKVWVKGSRKDFYTVERKYPNKVIRNFFDKISRNMHDALEALQKTKDAIKEVSPTLTKEEKATTDSMMEKIFLMELFYSAAHRYFEDFIAGKDIDIKLIQRAVQNPEKFQK